MSVIASQPLIFLPVLLQLTFLYGALFIGTVVLFLYLSLVAVDGSAFTNVLVAVNPETATATSGAEALQQVAVGTATWESFGVAIIIAFIVALVMIASAYTKSLVLGVLRDARAGLKPTLIATFRAGREFFVPCLRYYMPFAILLFIVALFGTHQQIVENAYILATGTSLDLVSYDAIWMAVALIAAVILRILTLYADPIIIAGSRRPVRDALADSFASPLRILVTAFVVGVALAVVLAVNMGLSLISSDAASVLVAIEIAGVLVFSLWRLWESGFLVFAWPRNSP